MKISERDESLMKLKSKQSTLATLINKQTNKQTSKQINSFLHCLITLCPLLTLTWKKTHHCGNKNITNIALEFQKKESKGSNSYKQTNK